MNSFGQTKLTKDELTKYYNDLHAQRSFGESLPLEKLKIKGLLSPDDEGSYHYWQIFILHDIMNMKIEYIFDFNDDLFKSLDKNKSIDWSEALACSMSFLGVRGLKNSLQFISCFRAISAYISDKNNLEWLYLKRSNRHWGESIDIPNYQETLNDIANRALIENSIEIEQLIDFIRYQCSRWEDVSCRDVAGEYKKNISYTVELYRRITSKTFDEVNQKVGFGDRQYFLPHERNVLDRVFPDWKKVAAYRSEATIKSICKNNLGLSERSIAKFHAIVKEKNLFQIYLAINEILEYRESFNQEGLSHLHKALRTLAICFEESARKFSGKSNSFKEGLEACWSPFDKGCIFQKGGFYEKLTPSKGCFIDQLQNIEKTSFRKCESCITENQAKILLRAILIRNHMVHEDLVDFENLSIIKYALTLLEAIILTFIKSEIHTRKAAQYTDK